MQPQAKESEKCQQTPGKEQILPHSVLRKHGPTNTLISEF